MSYGKPQPQRFQVYTELANGKGFTIKGSNYIFKFDRYGGWKDQHGNYYNADGQPNEEPQDAAITPSEGSLADDSQEDEYEKLYKGESDYEDGDEDQHLDTKYYQKVSKNMETLLNYPPNKELRLCYSNASYKLTAKDIFQAYSKKVEGIINIICQTIQENKRNGQGYFVLKDVHSAESLIKLQGEKVTQRQLYFQLEDVEEFIMDPLTSQELTPIHGKNKKKKFEPVAKKQEQQKNGKIKEKTLEKKEIKPEFSRYRLNFEIFSTKTRFVNWMNERNGARDVDYKNIEKKEIDGVNQVTLEVRNTLIDELKHQKYEQKEVIFTLL